MVRWRYCLVLAMLLLLPGKTGSKLEDDEEDDSRVTHISSNRLNSRLSSNRYNLQLSSRRGEENEEDDDDDEEEEEEEPPVGADKVERVTVMRRPPPIVQPTAKAMTVTRTLKKRPLECYVCAYKSETPLRACLDPTKYRVHTITCHSAEDKCFTSVISKGSSYEAVVRGCRSGCVGSPETTCCELNRCNNQAFAMPMIAPRPQPVVAPVSSPAKVPSSNIISSSKSNTSSKSTKSIPPTILFFVTVLLVLQTVVKVAFV